MITAGDTGQNGQRSVSPQVQSSGMTRQPRVTGTAENSSNDVQGDTMNTTLTAICSIPDADRVMTPRRVNARLAPGGPCGPPGGPRERGTRVARTPLAGEVARWQLILDLLDPDKRCGAWSPATFQGRPVVCTRAPHDAREEHANAETGWHWDDETSSPHPLSVTTHPGRAGICRPAGYPAAAGFPSRANVAPACQAGNRAIT
jgi:hypothetical protein